MKKKMSANGIKFLCTIHRGNIWIDFYGSIDEEVNCIEARKEHQLLKIGKGCL
jgi:hypothetical protein